jgi:hypothetical protein
MLGVGCAALLTPDCWLLLLLLAVAAVLGMGSTCAGLPAATPGCSALPLLLLLF